MKYIKKICTIIIGLLLLCSFGILASADGSNVTVTWIIPADMSIQIQYPTGESSQIVFEPGAKTFTDQKARGQTGSTPGINITNNGNTAVQINLSWNDAWYDAGLTFFNCSVGDDTNSTLVWWTNANETTGNYTVVASLSISATEEFWFWSSGTDMTESAIGEDTETLKVWYTNV